MSKKYLLVFLGILLSIALLIGSSYAYWMMTKSQIDKNVVNTGCFSISFNEKEGSDINLESSYPMNDIDGFNTPPYEFTIENTCDIYANYNINLEVLNTTTLSHDLIKAVIDDNEPKIVTEYNATSSSIDGASSYILLSGGMVNGESQTFNFRMWIDESATLENSQNKSIRTKIVIVSTAGEELLANHIINLYDKNNEGSNGLYLHNGRGNYVNYNLEAQDYSYRYSGATPNNFVCFGSDENPCPVENLYRIIGVVDKRVKLIKYDYAYKSSFGIDGEYYIDGVTTNYDTYKGEVTDISFYYWDKTTNINSWQDSLLNKVNLNKNFVNSFDSKWVNLINDSSWQVGGLEWVNASSNAKNAYDYEIGKNSKNITYQAKIGLMYLSEYFYAASPNYWTYPGYGDNLVDDYTSAANDNWMFMGIYEWAMTPRIPDVDRAHTISAPGNLYTWGKIAEDALAIRPTFELKDTTLYVSGDGSRNNPFVIK